MAALSLVVPLFGTSPAAAAVTTQPKDVAEVRVGLIHLGQAIAAVGQQPALSDDLPLTDTSVRDLLSLDTAVGTAVDDALATDGDATLDTLDQAFKDSAVKVTKVADADRLKGAPAASREWDLTIDLQGARKAALTYKDDAIQFGTARLGGDLAASLKATIRFRYDPDAISLRRFAVVGDPTLTTHVWSREDGSSSTTGQKVTIPGFSVIDGFVQMDAEGDATIDATTELAMRDPNGRGQITTEDFEFSSATDLFTTTERPGENAVRTTIDLSTSMSDQATGSISVGTRASDATTYAAPKIERSDVLKDLASLTRLQALTGFTQYTGALQAVESSVDQSFPLLDRSLTDLYSPTSDLLGLLTEQATATIVCGAADTSPPSGAPRPGEVRYCQATSAGLDVDKSDPGITWSSPDKGVSIDPKNLAGSVGTTPTRNVEVKGGDGFPTLRVEFRGDDGKKHVARSAVPSIQALGQAIGGLGLGGGVSYDATKKALTVEVEQSLDAQSEGTRVPTGGSGNLAPLTGLSGLCQAAKDSTPRRCLPSGDRPTPDGGTTVVTPEEGAATVTLGKRRFAADFGIGLGSSAAPVAGQPAPAGPAFYLVPGDGGLVYQVEDASASMPKDGQAAMVARIGFLQTDVDVTAYSTKSNGDAAKVTIPTTTVALPSKDEVDGAATVGGLLEPTEKTAPSAKRGLSASAELAVQDSEQAGGSRPIGKQGTVTATWADLRPSALPTVKTGGAYDALRLLDIVPARQGVMGEGSGDGTIKDPGADFVTQFGLEKVAAADRVVNRPLYDLGGEQSSTICTQYLVVSATELTCRQGPLAGKGVAAKGHPYVIDGDQDALRDIVLDDLAGLHSTLSTPVGGQKSNKAFPLVDVLPTELSAARDGLGVAISQVQDVANAEAPSVSLPATTSTVSRAATMQEFFTAFDTALKSVPGKVQNADSSKPQLKFTLDVAQQRLQLETTVTTAGTEKLPLSFGVGDSDVKIYNNAEVASPTVGVGSMATFAFGVDLATATSVVRGDTGTVEQITGVDNLDGTRQLLAGAPVDFGSSRLTTGAKADVQVGIGVKSVTSPAGSADSWTPIADFAKNLEQTRSVAGQAQGCGSTPKSAQIAACIKLPFDSASNVPALDVALTADEGAVSTGGSMKAKPIAYRFLAEGLGAMNKTLRDALDGDQIANAEDKPVSLPLVGTDLDAGVEVADDVTKYVSLVRTSLEPVETSVAETDKVSTLETELGKALTTLRDGLAGKKLAGTTGTPVIRCTGDVACAADKTVADVERISVPITLTGETPAKTSVPVPFQLGPIGSTIVSQLTVPATAAYSLKVTLGVARGKGSFVTLAHNSDADPLLKVDVKADLGEYAADRCSDWTRSAAWTASENPSAALRNGSVPLKSATTKPRCMDAFVGKFPAVLVDRSTSSTPATFVAATTKVNLGAATDGSDTSYVPALAKREREFVRTVSGDGKVSAYFESFAGKVGFVDVVGGIDLDWSGGGTGGGYGDGVSYGKLKLDVGTLNDAVLPGFKKALAWTAPLNPAVEQLSKPIPVVSDLSELVGKGPTSMLTLLAKKDTPITLIINLLQLQNVAAGVPAGKVDLRTIGANDIGGFKVKPYEVGVGGGSCSDKDTAKAKTGATTDGDQDGKAATSGGSKRCETGKLDKSKQYLKGEKPKEDAKGKEIKKDDVEPDKKKPGYISLPSVSLPVLQDTSQIFNLLQDTGDATMLYVDLGHAGIKGGVTKNFGPFAVGPIPVTATIGGEVKFDGRFAFGFDTRGLSRRIERLSTGDVAGFRKIVEAKEKPSLFSDGFYIDDLEDGEDVPEIQLTFTVTAGAAISIGIVSAGIQGGVTLDLSLDAFDPNGDGKIYSDEFAGASNGPSCAFNVSSGISFVLQFYFQIELLFYTIEESFDIVRSPRFKLFEFNCKVDEPVLATPAASATVTDSSGTERTGSTLYLNMGARTDERKGYGEDKTEKFSVRQVGQPKDGEVQLQVTAFNLVQNYTVPTGTIIAADGSDGSDTITMYPMPAVTTVDGQPQILGPGDDGYVAPTFSLGSVIRGGSEDDTIETSNGNDDVSGGDGKDAIRTGLGDDVVRGGENDDTIDGGQGTDRVFGDGGKDRVNGGAGADEVRGGEGDDTLDGGIGADPAGQFEIAKADLIRPTLDSGDLVVGGNGADRVTGGNGSDVVVGGSYSDDAAKLEATTSVDVTGTDATGDLVAVKVDQIPTIAPLDDDTIAAQCKKDGESGEVGPDQVTGGGEDDVVIGGGGSDTLSGGGGKDRVCGRGGDDLLEGDGTDVPTKQQGDDVVRGGSGRDRIYGFGGKDDLGGDAGDDLVRGGTGDDTIAGGAGADLLLGEKGLDVVDGDEAKGTSAVAAVDADKTSTGRDVVCAVSTSVVGGRIDLDGDLAGNDDGTLEGLTVKGGVVKAPDDESKNFTGFAGDVVFSDGLVDLDGDGRITARKKGVLGDTGSIPLAGITGATGNGDCILGGDEVDTRLSGGEGADYIDAGAGDDVNVFGGNGNDLVRGGEGDDTVHGDAGDDLVAGDVGDDILYGNADADVVRGGAGEDLLAGGSSTKDAPDGADEVLGDGEDDVVVGGNAALTRAAMAKTAIPGLGVTLLDTPATAGKDDQVFGGVGDDWVFGQTGDDATHGGPGDDVVEGGPGADLVQGDDGYDLLVGGSSTTGAVTTDRTAEGVPDAGDTVVGDEGVDDEDRSDVMVGDNARLQVTDDVRERWQSIRSGVAITLFDVPTPTSTPTAGSSGDDTMRAGGDADLVLGQSGDDTIDAGDGDDAVEGGAGTDTVDGGNGADRIVGGSWTDKTLDAKDTLSGGAGDDTVLGDNGRPADGLSLFVQLFDAPAPGDSPAGGTSGGDTIAGGAGRDRLFGQSGTDTVSGGDDVDVIEGGADLDTLFGDAGDDVLTGGTSSSDGRITPDRDGSGQLDARDVVSGGSGDDVVAGDNARIDLTSITRIDGTPMRSVQLFDLGTASKAARSGTSGNDSLDGDAGRDLVFGQGGADALTGGDDTDYLEGGDGADSLAGGAGEDDLVGGGSSRTGSIISVSGSSVVDRLLSPPAGTTDSSAATLLDGNDSLVGGDARDVLLGDNGRITRGGPLAILGGGASGPHAVRTVAMADRQPGVWAGSDSLVGGQGDDDLYGQFDSTRTKRPGQSFGGIGVPGDVLAGGDGDDALVGDQGVDVPTPAARFGSINRVLKDKKSFVRELVRPRGGLVRVVTTTQSTLGGDDLLLGDGGADSIHAGAGRDVVNAGAADDTVFGGNGADALWGGVGHDRVFGGEGNDLLDVKRRGGHSALWRAAAPLQDTDGRRRTTNGKDLLYGGSGADGLQADEGDSGRSRTGQGDRLIDWNGKANAFKVCRTGRGSGKVLDESSSSMVRTLRELVRSSGSVGSSELAVPTRERISKYPGRAGFVCER
ncbi:calcium-binding protein [Aeromicrobium sp. Root472D3]|uniref:calcium-binding protein n=1 Tax=Aeromicrobium sp. Root472D3 TaxID=1736540 RepID=UPI0012F81647|nr:calcium-binding protein [Aeromicrobium sp. Root472D3]